MALMPDYSAQARTYDNTRAASPSVLSPLRAALQGAPGTRLLDVGGGTGNYAVALRDEGWQPTVVDATGAMLARAAAKGLTCVCASALALPFAGGSVDAAMLVAMLHHTGEPARALAEAQRVVRPGGRVAVLAFALEDIATSWSRDYFPSSEPWMLATHPPLRDLQTWLPGATRLEVVYTDMVDRTFAALHAHPELVLQRDQRMQTSFFQRMERDHPDELRAGLTRLAADVAAGRGPRRPGTASMLAWVKPG
jgi:SAM-dependent methyltransferase